MSEEQKVEMISVETTRFGRIEVRTDKVIHLLGGLLGFPKSQRFAMLDHEKDSPFKWLQSLDEGELAVPITDPKMFFPDYHIKIKRDELAALRVTSAQELHVLVILSLRPDPAEMTANLKGPIIIHAERLIGRQVVLKDAPYSTRHLLFPELRASHFTEGETK
ncbi:MAG: flagellar assembly protein FliW [Candidatus Lernaella stagnicola]|nr:flagellar assembly protein FliW [Candidatus Lernaella stagnicola]